MDHPVQWSAPSPIWPALTSTTSLALRGTFRQPAILRFAADSFMEDFTATLAVDPTRIGELRAAPETWRGPLTATPATPLAPVFARALQRKRIASSRRATIGTPAAATIAPVVTAVGSPPLKLYQPAHQRYYLVAASLVCQLPGLPDRGIDPARQERVTFVLRRLLPRPNVQVPTADPATHDEYAFLPEGPGGAGWRKIASPQTTQAVVAGEEQQPLFPAVFAADDGRRRKLLTGLIPVGKRETYLAASASEDGGPGGAASNAPIIDPRIGLLRKQVIEPWNQIRTRATAVENVLREARTASPPASAAERESLRKDGREQVQTISWYVLLDLARFLEEHVPNVWTAVAGGAVALSPQESALVTSLNTTVYTRNGVALTMRAVLPAIRGLEAVLEAVTQPYTEGSGAWPSVLFPLAVIQPTEVLRPIAGDVAPGPTESVTGLVPSALEAGIKAALPAVATAALPEPPLATRPMMAGGDPGWFVIRCVYERPECGPSTPAVVSEPSAVFQLAGFFDPDAPARPIRIGLPMDVSPAGLRKFDKNTAFMMSDLLCGQVQRMKGVTLGDLVRTVLPFPLHKDLSVPAATPCSSSNGASIGMVCSLSIPIITICALILLMIIVSLLDIVFRWTPYFLLCFPLPGFKGKGGS
jgi:hypothetical protein